MMRVAIGFYTSDEMFVIIPPEDPTPRELAFHIPTLTVKLPENINPDEISTVDDRF